MLGVNNTEKWRVSALSRVGVTQTSTQISINCNGYLDKNANSNVVDKVVDTKGGDRIYDIALFNCMKEVTFARVELTSPELEVSFPTNQTISRIAAKTYNQQLKTIYNYNFTNIKIKC